jgi:acyl-CoA synthetase (AMP-forming)/AMP-acid ligase II
VIAGEKRRTAQGWSLRIDPDRASAARAGGWWPDHTAGDYAARLAAEDPTRVLVIDPMRTLDAATLFREAQLLARSFVRRGLKPGEVVSMMLPNWHESTIVSLAASLAGLVMHPVVTGYREAEVAFMLGDCDSRLIFIPEQFRGFSFADLMRTVCGSLARPPEVVILRGEPGEFTSFAAMFEGDDASTPLPTVDPDSVKILIYTSGTTGRAKGVIHTHNSTAAAATQIHRMWKVDGNDRFLIPSPVGHIGGSIYAFDLPVMFGARAVLQDVWDADEGVRIIDEQGCTFIAGATPFLQQLLAAARKVDSRLPTMRLFICGGASVPPTLIREAKAYLTSCTVTRVYGSTEVPVATIGSPDAGDADHAAETDGRPGAATAKLIDADGKEAAEGEIWLRGPQMLVGYLHLEDEQTSFDADGFFRTGDLARRVDDIYLVVSGRSKDLIIRNGENISPKEVEDLLVQHPKIAEIAIVGLPSQKTGELACAVIVPRPGETPDVADLRGFLEERRVARFKYPEQVELWPDLPRNPAGKVLKNKIRDALLESQREGAS